MEIRKVHKPVGFFVDFEEQWSSLINKCNWYTATLVRVEFENEVYTGRWVAEFWLLGFGVRVTYVYDGTFSERMSKMADDMCDGTTKPVALDEVISELKGRFPNATIEVAPEAADQLRRVGSPTKD